MKRLSRHGYLLPLVAVALVTACSSGADPIELTPLPGILEVLTRDLTIAADQSRAQFTVTNVGDLSMTVTVEGGSLLAQPSTFALNAGMSAQVVVSVQGDRLSSDVIVEDDNGHAVVIDVEVRPLRTERVSRTVVDTTVTISAGLTKSWPVDAPAGAVLRVAMAGGDDFDTYLWNATTEKRVAGTVFGDTLRASYEVGPLAEGRYSLVASNAGAWFFSRTVAVHAELVWEESIPARD